MLGHPNIFFVSHLPTNQIFWKSKKDKQTDGQIPHALCDKHFFFLILAIKSHSFWYENQI